jgi:serine/threonine-protein kinase
MGAVYRADDLRLGQPVALKFVDLGSHVNSVQNLYHEVRVARQVSHPNVCRVHDVVEGDGLCFIAMEYVDGEDLASLLRRIGRLPSAKATDVIRDIASGLEAAHERGIVHRDLKPANVMIDGSGRAHVTDFGLASLMGTDDELVAGTPAYMAPEQVAGGALTPRTDVYALGLLMHELFTGERVYGSASYAERRERGTARPRPVSESVKDVDPVIDAVIAACLAEDPAMRPASAREVRAMLPGGDAIDAAIAAGETPSPEMVAAAAETGEIPLRISAALAAAIVIVLGLVSWQSRAFLFTWMHKPPEVMSDRAEDVVSRAGETAVARDTTHFFDHDHALGRRWGALPRAQLEAMHPGLIHFIYRRSPARLVPRETIQVANDIFIFQSGRVTGDDPRLDVPGSAMVVLDHHAALVEYRGLPSGRAATPGWLPLLEATGIDMSTLAAATPQQTPPVASDARAAWTAAYRGQQERVRIEAASLNGRPAWLRVDGPWVAAESASPPETIGAAVSTVQLVVMIVITIIAIVATVRSLRRGRSDRTGALRFALFLGASLFAAWFIAAHHAHGPEDEARMLAAGLGEAAASALIVWVFYIALEPGVRRMWPRALIGWTRLLAGRFRDAMVGRELLVGIVGGIISYEAFWVTAIVRARLGHLMWFFIKAPALDPLAVYLGDSLIANAESIELALGTLFLYLLFRKAFGRIGGAAVFLLLVGMYALVSPGVTVFMVLLLFVLLRFGLLAGVIMGCTNQLLFSCPLTLDSEAWYWPRSLAVLLIVAGSATWAAWMATPRGFRSVVRGNG